jgi:hypothetical protein
MWLATLDGFFLHRHRHSGTEPDADSGSLRERHQQFIQSLPRQVPEHEAADKTSDDARDYRYRLSISQKDWVKLAGLLTGEVTYPNFKMAVQERADQANKGALLGNLVDDAASTDGRGQR